MRSLLVSLFCLIYTLSNSQNTRSGDQLILIHKVKEDRILLRWAPGSAQLWLQWPNAKITIKRKMWPNGSFSSSELPEMVCDTLTPWPMNKYESLVDSPKEDSLVLLVGYCMHASYESIHNQNLDLHSISDRKDEMDNRFSAALFAAERSADAATSMAMRYEDITADLSKNIAYTVTVYADDGLVYNKSVIYRPDQNIEFIPKIQGEESEGAVILSWDSEVHQKHYSAYWIERSSDTNQFERLTDVPYVHAFDINNRLENQDFIFIDSVNNYEPHRYRIIGLDAFGEESKPSMPLELMGRDKTPPLPPLNIEAQMMDESAMTINWSPPTVDEPVAYYQVLRDNDFSGDFNLQSELISKDSTSYIDYIPDYDRPTFYKVCALDTAGNRACTLPRAGILNDTFPPQAPIGLKGSIDSSGIVSLIWDRGKERDLYGYNVYFSNRIDGVYTILNNSPVTRLSFSDTVSVKTLTEDVFYSITAVDLRSNVSDFSDKIRIERPDIIPPGPAVFTEYAVRDTGIFLKWVLPSSRDLQLIVLTRSHNDYEDIIIDSFDNRTSTYLDQNLQPSIRYTYSLTTIDDSELKTKSPSPLSLVSSFKKNDLKVNLSFDEEQANTLRYSISSLENVDKLIIYRSMSQRPFVTWKSLNASNIENEGSLPVINDSSIKYKAILKSKSGLRSKFSTIVSCK